MYPAIVPGEAPAYRIRVKGNPNLGNIQTILMGVKNESNTPVDAELWFDELRLTGFQNDGGWAGVVSADANLADFADLSLTAGIETTGFGGVEQSLTERSLEDIKQYDFVTNVNLGMLTPKKWGLQIPFNYGISKEIRDPKYDQQYQDVLFKDAADINEFVCKEAFVIPINTLSPTAGFLPSACNFSLLFSNLILSTISPGRYDESPEFLTSIFFNICLKIVSICLSLIITP